jgi:pimeloyl-ACP methyl ester carboxylesterase
LYISIDGINTHYDDRGSGDIIVLLQGWGTDLSLYEGLISHFSKTHRVIAPELPGFGETPEPPEPWGVTEYSDFVLKFLDRLNVKKAVLVGHSNGGRIIIKAVGSGANIAVPKIILIGSAGIVPEKTPEQLRRQKRYKMGKTLLSSAPVKLIFPNALEAFKQKSGSADYRNATPLMRDTLVKLVNEDLSALLPLIKQPTLLVWGEKDDATPVTDAKRMEELLPDGGLVIVKGAGHYCYLEQPNFVFRVLDSFLGVK